MMGWGWGPYGYGMMGGWGWLIQLLLLAAIIYVLVRAFSGPARPTETSSRALDILRERYAKGEIDQETFERMKAELNK
ncbi:MAG: SHOCT domain-containing protein [Deinococcus sp.]|nr:SHOCT domain-containing protein [Deinococcus sp.]